MLHGSVSSEKNKKNRPGRNGENIFFHYQQGEHIFSEIYVVYPHGQRSSYHHHFCFCQVLKVQKTHQLEIEMLETCYQVFFQQLQQCKHILKLIFFNLSKLFESEFMIIFPMIILFAFFNPKLFNFKQIIWRCILNGLVWSFAIRTIPWIAITLHLIYWFQINWFVICKRCLILCIKLSAITIVPLPNRWTPSYKSLCLTAPLSMKVKPCFPQA